jgi:hypothetical protein
MKSLPKSAILGLLLLLAAPAIEAASIASTDATNFNPKAYISQWQAGLTPGADAVANFPLQPGLLNTPGVDSPASVTTPEGDAGLQSSGIVSLLNEVDRDKPDKPKHKHKPKPPATVPEPGALSLIGLGLLALALMTGRARRLR